MDSTAAGMATPYSVQTFDEVTSTQDLAASMANSGPVLVVAGRQMAGRGRSGSQWLNAERAMAASLAFVPHWPRKDWSLIPLVAGLAAAEVVGPECRLKWPNDLLIDATKVGGVLSEASGDLVITGCGLNLYWPDRPPGMAAIYPDDPGPLRHIDLARHWADALLNRLARGPGAWGRDDYVSRSATLGSLISWEPRGEGTAIDIGDDGALVVMTAEGEVRLTAGSVRHVRS
ncbi:MAG TPA: biotin--[acetyl-CoA-carboxylase] ligase [Acidimicrobiia bacterium]|nr:biotin--[acetyl-CoA-carboxylase] ligase [Acidimicrobiia bacterium]